ncbi:MAG: hypothetical protein MUC97_12330 [Bernardetiaceae bacterium]|nr:hypothetical protein [Bernardetiaceae bacterium]
MFALLDTQSKNIVTLIFLDGDFLNYDFDLHKESKYANFTEYNHGPYGEGSVRHRRMYTYPNPLNSKIGQFHMRQVVIAKKLNFERLKDINHIDTQIIRTDRYGNSFIYYLKDETKSQVVSENALITLEGIFDSCKVRKPKERTAAMPILLPLNPSYHV